MPTSRPVRMIPPNQDRGPSIRNDVAIVVFTVLIIIVILFAVAFYMVSLLDQSFEEANEENQFPHGLSRLKNVEPTRVRTIPAPVSYEVLGNATGTQHLVILDKTGILVVYSSNDLFSNNISSSHLTQFEFSDLTDVRLEFGRVLNGSVGVHAHRGSFDWYWVQSSSNGTFQEVDGPLTLTGSQRPVYEVGDLPASDRIRDYGARWDTIRLDGRDVLVAEFHDWGGCLEYSYCPGVAFKMPNGQWSNIVSLGGASPDGISIAGTSMKDMFVVTWSEDRNSVGWWFYSITDDSVMKAGVPPLQG